MDDTELRKEMFAWLGGATYHAQLFEYALVSLIIVLRRFEDSELPDVNTDEIERMLSSKTTGMLLSELRKHVVMGNELDRRFRRHLETRNRLVHRFCRENGMKMTNRAGTEECIEELKNICVDMEEADNICESLTKAVFKAGGWTDEELEALIKREFEAMTE